MRHMLIYHVCLLWCFIPNTSTSPVKNIIHGRGLRVTMKCLSLLSPFLLLCRHTSTTRPRLVVVHGHLPIILPTARPARLPQVGRGDHDVITWEAWEVDCFLRVVKLISSLLVFLPLCLLKSEIAARLKWKELKISSRSSRFAWNNFSIRGMVKY